METECGCRLLFGGTSHAFENLPATGFVSLDEETLDLSGSGAPIQFGVISWNGTSTNEPIHSISGIDNWHVTAHCATECPADLNGDGIVDGADLGALLANWGQSGASDLNDDGVTDGADLGLLLGAWGVCE